MNENFKMKSFVYFVRLLLESEIFLHKKYDSIIIHYYFKIKINNEKKQPFGQSSSTKDNKKFKIK